MAPKKASNSKNKAKKQQQPIQKKRDSPPPSPLQKPRAPPPPSHPDPDSLMRQLKAALKLQKQVDREIEEERLQAIQQQQQHPIIIINDDSANQDQEEENGMIEQQPMNEEEIDLNNNNPLPQQQAQQQQQQQHERIFNNTIKGRPLVKLSKLQKACKVYVKVRSSHPDNNNHEEDNSIINEEQVKEMLSKLQTSRKGQNGNNDDGSAVGCYYFSKVIAENQEFYLLQLGKGITTSTIKKTAKTCGIAPYHLLALSRKNTNLNDDDNE